MNDHEEPSKVAKKQSMLYEICTLCSGTGKSEQLPNRCLCKMLGVNETGATAAQLEGLARRDLQRQESGISARMLRDGSVRKIVDAVRSIITKADACQVTNDYLEGEIRILKEAIQPGIGVSVEGH